MGSPAGQSGFISNYVCLVADTETDVNLDDDCDDDTETSVDGEEPTHLSDDNNIDDKNMILTIVTSQAQVTSQLLRCFDGFRINCQLIIRGKLLSPQAVSDQILTVLFPNI